MCSAGELCLSELQGSPIGSSAGETVVAAAGCVQEHGVVRKTITASWELCIEKGDGVELFLMVNFLGKKCP